MRPALLAATLVVASWFVESPVQSALFRPLLHETGLHLITADKHLALLPFGILMVIRLAWNVAVFAIVCRILDEPALGFPIAARRPPTLLAIGWLIGAAVMAATVLGIVGVGAAQLAPGIPNASDGAFYGVGWAAFNVVGAAEEELFGRATILLIAARLVGWRAAIVVSGLSFIVIHLDNPGASAVWLLRLFLQGVLLAYAVYRTRSLWWSIGYHAGWNWASAPLFGAAGSGYLDQGQLLSFTPTGSVYLTGGDVGPEGSLFAFVAVAAAFILLTRLYPSRPEGSEAEPGR